MCTLVRIGVHPYRPAGMLCQDQLYTSASQITALIRLELGYVHHATGLGLGLHTSVQSPTGHTTLSVIQPMLFQCWAMQRRRQWDNIEAALGECPVFAGLPKIFSSLAQCIGRRPNTQH